MDHRGNRRGDRLREHRYSYAKVKTLYEPVSDRAQLCHS